MANVNLIVRGCRMLFEIWKSVLKKDERKEFLS